MRVALVALVLALPAASSAEAPATSPSRPAATATPIQSTAAGRFVPSRICGDAMRPRHADTPGAPRPRRLGELPAGDLTLTVVNRVGDCIEPRVVRQGYGEVASGIRR